MGRTQQAIEQLRMAIDCLPVDTRVAMLEGVRRNDIIAGAYTDRQGGICPMLAAHRCGGRTDFVTFARAWDRFTRAKGRPRRASERELRVLTAHLEASLLTGGGTDLAGAIAEHRDLMARRLSGVCAAERPRATPRPGDRDRGRELRERAGWAWLRPFRSVDGYEHAIARAEAERGALRDEVAERELALVR